MKHPLSLAIDAGVERSLHAIMALPAFRSPPAELRIDYEDVPVDANWQRTILTAQKEARADWPDPTEKPAVKQLLSTDPKTGCIAFQFSDAFSTLDQALGYVEGLPFDVCSIFKHRPKEWRALDLEPFTFDTGHVAHGWGCAFRGDGHSRLVSRRWLDFGPWRILNRPNDLTVVQFHDLDAPLQTAADQALPGWKRMGPSRTGGYIQKRHRFRTQVEGIYTEATRTLEIVVPPGGKIEQFQMLDACAVRVRHHAAPESDRPIDEVAYVFLDVTDARAHLHEMWLRELQVWAVDAGGRRRIDLDYSPQPEKPEWVRNLEARG